MDQCYFCKGRISHKTITYMHTWQELPMTTTGKVRRRDLRELEHQRKSEGKA